MNPFPKLSPLQQVRLNELLDVAHQSWSRDWNSGTAGNFSIRGSSGVFWQSPSGVDKGSMNKKSFVPLTIEGATKIRPFKEKPSAESPLHGAIYRLFPSANAVVHVHPPQLVARTQDAAKLQFSGQEMSKAFGVPSHEETIEIPVMPNTQDMHELAGQLDKLCNHTMPLFALSGHGVYAWAKEPITALHYVEALEFLCQTVK